MFLIRKQLHISPGELLELLIENHHIDRDFRISSQQHKFPHITLHHRCYDDGITVRLIDFIKLKMMSYVTFARRKKILLDMFLLILHDFVEIAFQILYQILLVG